MKEILMIILILCIIKGSTVDAGYGLLSGSPFLQLWKRNFDFSLKQGCRNSVSARNLILPSIAPKRMRNPAPIITQNGFLSAGGAVMCGSVARKGQFKYVVEIIQTDNETFLYCTGAIIDPSHILTAAHCVLNNIGIELSIIAGTVNLRSRSLIERKVAKVYIHEKFTFEGSKCGRWGQFKKWLRRIWDFIKNEQGMYKIQNDIAVLRLDEALPLGNNIEIVSLPTFGLLPYCEDCEYAGWGDVDEDGRFSMRLRWMNMLILTPQDCNDFNARHYPNQFCAIHPEKTSCPLSGDSGAPLVYRNTVFGVTSNGCGAPESPTIFSNVFDHLDFIQQALTD